MQELHGKMVINIVLSQILVYLSLFVGTFKSAEVCVSNSGCLTQGKQRIRTYKSS